MTYSTQSAVSDGTLSTLGISIEYFDAVDITVYLDNVIQTVGTTWDWSSPTEILFTPVLAAGVVVLVKRTTPLESPRHVFNVPGSAPWNKRTVDENFQQTLYSAQEAQEGSVKDHYNNVDMHGFRLQNLGTAVEVTDAVNLQQLRDTAFGTGLTDPQTFYTTVFTATEGQVDFVVTNIPGKTIVVLNGSTLTYGEEYFSDGSKITLAYPAVAGGSLVVNAFIVFEVAGAVSITDLADQTDPLKGAGMVGYVRAAVGAVVTTLKKLLGWQVATVFEFMTETQIADVLARTATIDVTAPIQAAAAAGIFRCPAGTYKITSGINITSKLLGDGPTQTIFYVSGSGYDAVTLSADNASLEAVGFFSPTPRTSGAAIKLAPSKRSQKVKNFRMQNQHTGIVVGDGSVISEIESGEILDTCPTTGIGIDILGGNDTFITRVVMDTSGVEPHAGIRIQKTDAVWLTDNDFIHSGNGLEIVPNGALGQYITWIFGTNNAFDSSVGGTGTYIRAINGATIRGIELLGHWCATNVMGMSISTDGAVGSSIDGVKLDSPRLLNNKQHGLLVDGGAQVANVCIIEPTVAGNNGSAGAYDGIVFGNNSTLFTVRGGKSGAALGFAGAQRYGVTVASGCTNYEVADMDLTGNATSAMANGSIGAADGRVRNNVGAKTRSIGTATFDTGATEMLITHGLAFAPSIALATPFNTNIGSLSYWVGSITSTTFKINFSGATSGAGIFSWQAEV